MFSSINGRKLLLVNPKLHLIAGPNGAGKTTFAGQFLPRYTQSREFVNADNIAQRISPANPEPVIRRRYLAGIKNLFDIYRLMLNSWSLFDNSQNSPYLIAREINLNLVVLDTKLFKKCSAMATNPTDETLRESAGMPEWMLALTALRLAKAEVVEEHLKTGHPLIIWRDGKVYRQPPEEAKRELEQAAKIDFKDGNI